jgi:hypothetical protein
LSRFVLEICVVKVRVVCVDSALTRITPQLNEGGCIEPDAHLLELRVEDTDGETITGLGAIDMTAVGSHLELCSPDVELDLLLEIPTCLVQGFQLPLSLGLCRVDGLIVVKHCLCLAYLDSSVSSSRYCRGRPIHLMHCNNIIPFRR